LQESVHEFRNLDEEVELQPILEQLATYPPLDRSPSEEAEARLPEMAGGISVALAHTFRLIDPNLKNPQTWQRERAFQISDRLM
jgi:hypothetical protein